MDELEKLKKDVEDIKARNKKVELQKAWETSTARKIAIIVITYSFMTVVFALVMDSERPFIDAFIPTCGFFLSTLSLGIVRDRWIQRNS